MINLKFDDVSYSFKCQTNQQRSLVSCRQGVAAVAEVVLVHVAVMVNEVVVIKVDGVMVAGGLLVRWLLVGCQSRILRLVYKF